MGEAMDEPHLTAQSANRAPLAFGEFVALVAAMMALTALGIDSMLPALPAIGESLGVANANHRQYVITAFLIGFAFAQLAYGPLSDRYGRRPVLAIALASYVVTTALAASAGSFTLLLIARAAMGASAGRTSRKPKRTTMADTPATTAANTASRRAQVASAE